MQPREEINNTWTTITTLQDTRCTPSIDTAMRTLQTHIYDVNGACEFDLAMPPCGECSGSVYDAVTLDDERDITTFVVPVPDGYYDDENTDGHNHGMMMTTKNKSSNVLRLRNGGEHFSIVVAQMMVNAGPGLSEYDAINLLISSNFPGFHLVSISNNNIGFIPSLILNF